MKYLFNQLKYLARLLGLLWLAVNISLASIPRCDTIFNAMQKIESLLATASAQPQMHCHQAKTVETKSVALRSDRSCKCSLAQMVFAILPTQTAAEFSKLSIDHVRVVPAYFRWAPNPDFTLETPPPRIA